VEVARPDSDVRGLGELDERRQVSRVVREIAVHRHEAVVAQLQAAAKALAIGAADTQSTGAPQDRDPADP
jgi:hypothetical protein